jgi:hypothetical protein
MNLLLKILRLLAILIITVSILLFSASLLLQEKVAGIILKSLNENISTKLNIASFRLSFLKKFPKASLELKNVLVHSSRDFDSESFTGINTDTLLSAKYVSLEFRITDILKGIYNIERIGARNGRVNVFVDNAGFINYNISLKNKGNEGNDLTINLEKIYINDMKASYNNLAISLKMKGDIKNGRLKSRISGSNIDFTALADIQINRFQCFNTILTKPVKANLDLILNSSKKGILFKKSILSIENYNFGLKGFLSSDNVLDFNITGNNIDISRIRNYLPEKYFKLVSEYDPSGILLLNSKIRGLLSKTSNPHIEVNCSLNKGHITYSKSDLSVDNLSFSGYYSNGSKNNSETSIVSLKDIKGSIGSAEYRGSILISDFKKPRTELNLKGKIFPAELKEFFGIKNISTTRGSADLDLKLATDFWPKEKLSIDDIFYLRPEGKLTFNSLTIGLNHDSISVEDLNGNLEIGNTVKADKVEFSYKGQKIKIDGIFKNLPEWLAGRQVQMIAAADVSCDRLIPELFFKDSKPAGNKTSDKNPFSLSGDIFLDINFKVDNFKYKLFSSSKNIGILNYKPGLLTFKSLNMESLRGVISGNGFVSQNRNKSIIIKGNFNVDKIDINDAFTTFHNFGQQFLKAENIRGTLSGKISILLPMDSQMNPQVAALNAEGKYQLVDGELVNFEPVKQLSRFIELSELENIYFETLENDFFIRNNFLFIPQMDVKSSAVDLSVNGKHSFENDYEYHVKMLLSEILSRKRKKSKSNISEFGVIEDDGLGRTTLLLKVVNKGDDVKVSYDIKAAGNKIIDNIKAERKTLKNILNQEYGWYKNDTTIKQKPVEKSQRFKISYGETDSIKTSNQPVIKKKPTEKKKFSIE